MYRFWNNVTFPLIEILQPRTIVEIGCGDGANTVHLLAYCRTSGARLYAIDPNPGFDYRSWSEQNREVLVFLPELSLKALEKVEKSDLVLIDGDHNWYTVFHELNKLAENCQRDGWPFPVVMLHDVSWPYGRRDLYYFPDSIPTEYRQPFEKRGVEPDKKDLAESGGLNSDFHHAVKEGGPKNGVLTAVEDFLKQYNREQLDLLLLPGFHGLGIIVSQALRRRNQRLNQWLNSFSMSEQVRSYCEALEKNRIQLEISRDEWKKRAYRDEEKIASFQEQLLKAEEKEKENSQALQKERESRLRAEQKVDELRKELKSVRHELELKLKKISDELAEQKRLLSEAQNEKERLLYSLQEKDAYVRRMESELLLLRERIAYLESEYANQKEIARLAEKKIDLACSTLEQADKLAAVIDAICRSKRWKIGNLLGDYYHRLPGVRAVPDIRQYVKKIRQSYEKWRKENEKQFDESIGKPERSATSSKDYEQFCARLPKRLLGKEIPPEKITLVLYSVGKLEPLRRALISIRRWTARDSYNLVLIDDSQDTYLNGEIDRLCQGDESITVVHLKQPMGYFQALRYAYENCHQDICLVREDTVVTPGWLSFLKEAAYSLENCGLISPLSNCHPALPFHMKAGDNIVSCAKKLKLLSPGERPVAFPHLDTVYFKRRFLDEVLPRLSSENGERAFLDLLCKMIESNWLPIMADDVFVYHAARFCKFTDDYVKQLISGASENVKNLCQGLWDYTRGLSLKVLQAYLDSDIKLVNRPTLAVLYNTITLCGGVLILNDLVDELVLCDVDVKVFLLQKNKYERQYFDLLVEPIPFSEARTVADLLPNGAAVLATFWSTATLAAEIVKHKPSLKGYYFVQDYEPDFYHPEKERDYFEGAKKSYLLPLEILTTSDWIIKKLSHNLGNDLRKVHKIGCGINLELFSRPFREKTSDKVKIIAMARPETPRRGFEILIRALQLVHHARPQVEIRLFGSEQIERMDIPFPFVSLGKIKQEDLVEEYFQSDIFVDSSLFQGFGLPALEAMACGCACVITDSGGVSEYAIDGKNCLMAPAGDPERLAQRILELVDNETLRHQVAAVGWYEARKHSNHQVAVNFRKLLERGVSLYQTEVLRRQSDETCNIVVPVFNQLHVAKSCLESIVRYTRPPYRVYVVDDASDQYTADFLKKFCDEHKGFFYLRNENNQGFVSSANRGMLATPSGDIVLLNSDTIVTEGWLDKLLRCAKSDPRIGIISPLSTSSSHLWIRVNPGDTIFSAAQRIEKISPRAYPDVVTPEGWCFFIRREVFELLGPFDSIYGRGYCEESDYCMQALANGWRLVCCDDTLIFHQGRVTFGSERGPRYQHNRAIFDRRWKPLYEKVYRGFLKRDPLAEVRRRYALVENKFLREEEIRQIAYPPITAILDDPILPRDIEKYLEFSKSLSVKNVDKPRIVFLLATLEQAGGVISVVQLANDLVMEGLDVKLVVLTNNRFFPEFELFTEPIFFRDWNEMLRHFPPADIVVGTLWITMYYIVRLFLNRRDFLPVYFVQDYEVDFYPPSEEKTRYWIGLTYKFTPWLFAKTEYLKKKFEELGYSLHVVPPAIDLDLFYPRQVKKSQTKKILSMIRPSTPYRGAKTVVEVISHLSRLRNDFEFHCFGCSDEELRQLGVDFRVINHGTVKNSSLPDLYSSAYVFLDFSEFHGFGRNVAEAMACGVPAVLTDSGGVNSFAVDEHNCLIVSSGDRQELVSALIRLLDDVELRERLAKNCRSSVIKFDRRHSARETLRFFKECLEKQSQQRSKSC